MIDNAIEGLPPRYLTKIRKRMETIDDLPADIRDLVHEFNWVIVDAFLRCGVKKANHIRHLINVVRQGSAAYSNIGNNQFLDRIDRLEAENRRLRSEIARKSS